jgi:hypothetical protein
MLIKADCIDRAARSGKLGDFHWLEVLACSLNDVKEVLST